jgi:nitrous oxidase accessory protein NosD
MTRPFVAFLLGASLLVSAAPSGPAAARPRCIDVFHGESTLARAVERARPGDVLRVHRGRYRETLVIDVPVTIKAVGPGKVIVDGRCQARFSIDVLADHVTLKGFTVQGATSGFGDFPSEVNFSGVSDGAARRMLFRDTCDAEYGINVFGTGSMVVRRSEARGFSDAGIYIGGVTEGPVTAVDNDTHDSNRGIIVEDSTLGTVVVLDNRAHDNLAPGGEPRRGSSSTTATASSSRATW